MIRDGESTVNPFHSTRANLLADSYPHEIRLNRTKHKRRYIGAYRGRGDP